MSPESQKEKRKIRAKNKNKPTNKKTKTIFEDIMAENILHLVNDIHFTIKLSKPTQDKPRKIKPTHIIIKSLKNQK